MLYKRKTYNLRINNLFTQKLLQLVQQSRDAFNSGKTRPIEWRIKQLKQLLRMVTETSSEITVALASDLHRV